LPRRTAEWTRTRTTDDVHHVRLGDPSDLARVTRILTGRAVSLVLSGGGARGFAHLGVLRALDELKVPIDLVGGTSIGAVISMLPALETPVDDMPALIQEQFHRVFDFTLPVASVISGKRIAEALRNSLGDICIEDLWLPYFCVSASLTRATGVVHRRGSLATAVRASASIPGLMPPVALGDDLLVDGGVIDNLPVREMRQLNPRGLIIGVDVAPATDTTTPTAHGEWLSGWNALWSTMRKKNQIPPLAQTVLRSMLVAANRDRDRLLAEDIGDLYLGVDVHNCDPFDFEAVEQTANAGYEATRARLEAWWAAVGAPS
jgi:predicted acylesterase/phospholipase RssA